MQVILASKSPRRAELLKEIFPSFDIMPQNVDENISEKDPQKMVEALALKKLNDLDKIYKDALIISSDTIVWLNGKVYGKPHTIENAINTLKALSGTTHHVYTGVCVAYKGNRYVFSDESKIQFREVNDEEIKTYVLEKKPLDKAGAYGIQDGDMVKGYEGSYSNIMGLPVEKLKEELKKIGAVWETFNC